MKKNILIIILVLFSTGMIFSNELQGRIHTITTKKTDTSKTDQVINVIIRTEGTKRIVSVPKSKNETITVGYQLSDGEFYKEDGKTKLEKAAQYYEYVRNINSIIDSADGILELENVGYYEGLVKIKKSTSSNDDYYDIEIIPQARKVLIVIEGNGNPKVITFSDKYTLADVDSKVLTGWVEWLKDDKTSQPSKTSEQRTEEEIEQYRRLSQRVYLSLNSPYPYKGLYDEGGEYLRKYLNIRYALNMESAYSDMNQAVNDAKFYVESNLIYRKEYFGEKHVDYLVEAIRILTEENIKFEEKISKIKKIGGLTNKEFLTVLTGIKNNDLSTIEKNGEIVPFLKEVKSGDIVSFNQNSSLESGIVVNVSESKEKIEIAYMDKTTAKAIIVELSELNASDVVVVRKLNGTKKEHKDANWNVLFDKMISVEIHIETMKESTQISNEKHRWIPNTGEYLILDEIKVTINSIFGLEKVKNDKPIYLVGAVDRGYLESPSDGDYGNIYKNTANLFELKIDEETYLLERNQTSSVYRIYQKDSSGILPLEETLSQEKIAFKVDEKGYIKNGKGALKIQIRPVEDQIYPGDDLLLLFKIGETEYTVEPEDYIAVYDKKMLWRANQYIEEPEARLQNLDWNNAHPWNAPSKDSAEVKEEVKTWWSNDWGYNEWNKSYNPETDKNKEIKDLVEGNGGQIPIQGWTRFNDDEDVNGSVAYGWGCFDSIIAFNDELRKQSKAIRDYIDNNNEADKKYEINWEESDLGVYAPTREKVEKKTETSNTTSPQPQEGKKWENYIFPDVSSVFEVNTKKLKDREKADLFISTNTGLCVPGLSTYWYSLDMKKGTYYRYDQAVRTSGVDCSGLAYISTQYTDNKYETNQFNMVDKPNASNFAGKTEAWIGKETTIRPLSDAIFAASSKNQWIISIPEENLETDEKENRDKQRKLLSYAVPGDILVKDSHVVIIQDLIYDGKNTVITDYSQVNVIHATSGEENAWQTWQVHKSKWNEVEDDENIMKLYQLRRLKSEEEK